MILLEGLVAPPSRRLSCGRLAAPRGQDALTTAGKACPERSRGDARATNNCCGYI